MKTKRPRYELNLTRCMSILHECKDPYNGAGIYALVDNYGKKYIGQAKHIQDRIKVHRINMNKIFLTNCFHGENDKIHEAIMAGKTFDVEILEKIPQEKATRRYLYEREIYYYCQYGGIDNLYNVAPLTNM